MTRTIAPIRAETRSLWPSSPVPMSGRMAARGASSVPGYPPAPSWTNDSVNSSWRHRERKQRGDESGVIAMLPSRAHPLLQDRNGSSRADARAWQMWRHHDHGRIARSREGVEYGPHSYHRSRQPRGLALRGGDLSSRGGVGAAGARRLADRALLARVAGQAGAHRLTLRGGGRGAYVTRRC